MATEPSSAPEITEAQRIRIEQASNRRYERKVAATNLRNAELNARVRVLEWDNRMLKMRLEYNHVAQLQAKLTLMHERFRLVKEIVSSPVDDWIAVHEPAQRDELPAPNRKAGE